MTDLHLHDSVMYGDLHIHKSDPAFALAWAIIKEEQEEPAPDPVMPPESQWTRFKRGMKNMGRIFMNPREMGPKVREEERNHEANRTAAWEAEQQQLREQQEQQEADASQSNLAQVFGHQEDEPEIDPDQMTLDQFGQPQLPNLFDYEGG